MQPQSLLWGCIDWVHPHGWSQNLTRDPLTVPLSNPSFPLPEWTYPHLSPSPSWAVPQGSTMILTIIRDPHLRAPPRLVDGRVQLGPVLDQSQTKLPRDMQNNLMYGQDRHVIPRFPPGTTIKSHLQRSYVDHISDGLVNKQVVPHCGIGLHLRELHRSLGNLGGHRCVQRGFWSKKIISSQVVYDYTFFWTAFGTYTCFKMK